MSVCVCILTNSVNLVALFHFESPPALLSAHISNDSIA